MVSCSLRTALGYPANGCQAAIECHNSPRSLASQDHLWEVLTTLQKSIHKNLINQARQITFQVNNLSTKPCYVAFHTCFNFLPCIISLGLVIMTWIDLQAKSLLPCVMQGDFCLQKIKLKIAYVFSEQLCNAQSNS